MPRARGASAASNPSQGEEPEEEEGDEDKLGALASYLTPYPSLPSLTIAWTLYLFALAGVENTLTPKG